MGIYTPYFYVIRDVRNGIRYAGCKYAKGCSPDAFMNPNHKKPYYTSSTTVKRIIAEHGPEVFEIEILKPESECGMPVLEYETRWLRDHDCARSKLWYNRSDNMRGKCVAPGSAKYKEEMRMRYGVDNPSQLPDYRKKVVDTNLKRYGFSHQMKNPEVAKVRVAKVTANKYLNGTTGKGIPKSADHAKKIGEATAGVSKTTKIVKDGIEMHVTIKEFTRKYSQEGWARVCKNGRAPKPNLGMTGKHLSHSAETKKAISERRKGIPNGNQPHLYAVYMNDHRVVSSSKKLLTDWYGLKFDYASRVDGHRVDVMKNANPTPNTMVFYCEPV